LKLFELQNQTNFVQFLFVFSQSKKSILEYFFKDNIVAQSND
jgi:hypothetical protein